MSLQQEKILTTLNKVLKQTPRLRKGGIQAMYYCPNCKHYKRKLEILLTEGKYHCWVCGFGGMNFGTLLKKLNAPRECYEMVGEVKKIKVKDTFNNFFNTKEQSINNVNTLPDDFKPLYEHNNSTEYKHALNYIKTRGITDCDIYRYNIGYCSEGDYKNRVMIPSYDIDGNLNFFSGRDFFNKSWLKYVNCDFTKDVIGFEMLIDFSDEVTLVEGSFDAIAVRKNCIPLFGKTLSQKLKIKLLEKMPPCVNILLDNDALKDSIRICDFLVKNGIPTKLVRLDEKDPSVLGFEKTWQYINQTKLITFDKLFNIKINL